MTGAFEGVRLTSTRLTGFAYPYHQPTSEDGVLEYVAFHASSSIVTFYVSHSLFPPQSFLIFWMHHHAAATLLRISSTRHLFGFQHRNLRQNVGVSKFKSDMTVSRAKKREHPISSLVWNSERTLDRLRWRTFTFDR